MSHKKKTDVALYTAHLRIFAFDSFTSTIFVSILCFSKTKTKIKQVAQERNTDSFSKMSKDQASKLGKKERRRKRRKE